MCVKDRPCAVNFASSARLRKTSPTACSRGGKNLLSRNETAGCYGMIWNVDGSGVCANGVQGLHMSRRMHATYGVRVVVFTIIQYKH